MTALEELRMVSTMLGLVLISGFSLLFFLVCAVKCCTYAYLKAKYRFESRYPKKENGTNGNSS